MLDADFEYGLQPTKWQAIATQRGYPSIYEVPGTDKQVQSVVTDASVGTGGIGQSLITVTTIGAHGIETGSPITLKALENSVAGASRAEGSFIVSTVPTNSTLHILQNQKLVHLMVKYFQHSIHNYDKQDFIQVQILVIQHLLFYHKVPQAYYIIH